MRNTVASESCIMFYIHHKPAYILSIYLFIFGEDTGCCSLNYLLAALATFNFLAVNYTQQKQTLL